MIIMQRNKHKNTARAVKLNAASDTLSRRSAFMSFCETDKN